MGRYIARGMCTIALGEGQTRETLTEVMTMTSRENVGIKGTYSIFESTSYDSVFFQEFHAWTITIKYHSNADHELAARPPPFIRCYKPPQ
jgi:hypothetical protein